MSGKKALFRIRLIFAVTIVSLLLWGLSAGLSYRLAGSRGRSNTEAATVGSQEQPRIAMLRVEAVSKPDSSAARLKLARALFDEAQSSANGQMLMDAAEEFHQVLTLEPENSEALLALAELCLQAGVTEKAVDYYSRYLRTHPDDLHVTTDYAYALFLDNQREKAERVLKEILTKAADFVPAMMMQAYFYKTTGLVEQARKRAQEAKAVAAEAVLIAAIDEFLFDLSPKEAPRDYVSPAQILKRFFSEDWTFRRNLLSVSWPEAKIVLVVLRDFSFSRLSEVERQALTDEIKRQLKTLPEEISVKLRAGNDEELLIEAEH